MVFHLNFASLLTQDKRQFFWSVSNLTQTMKHLWILWILSLHFLKIEGLNCSATFTKTNFVLDDYLQGQRK